MNTHITDHQPNKPEILAPAGNKASFFAAVSAGADAVYCGLKAYSARMAAKNFTVSELAKLISLGRARNVKVYVAFNTLLGTKDLDPSAALLLQLVKNACPDALIVQDLAVIQLARQAGFNGEIHLSTLANVGFPQGLGMICDQFGIDRAVVPRELTIDEIKSMSAACPSGLKLEVFIHGALCYAVSGRCYWSSYLGGKSGLSGKCVQPCRRQYDQGGRRKKFFSCQDLCLDVLVKVLKDVPNIGAWKIEGRKKGPHYVYYTTSAYRMLRDEGSDPKIKKSAMGLLERALGRSGTHYFFLPQRKFNPVDPDRQTGSGLLVGAVDGPGHNPYLVPREELLPGDVLRVGYEDETWHKTFRVGKYVPKKGRFHLKTGDRKGPVGGTPVFLTDRQEKELKHLIRGFQDEMDRIPDIRVKEETVHLKLPAKNDSGFPVTDMTVYRNRSKVQSLKGNGLWLSRGNVAHFSGKRGIHAWWWLPPVIWPEDADGFAMLIKTLVDKGERQFVLNAPWQRSFFEKRNKLRLWAGPFCNIANPLAVLELKKAGFSGAIVSPELSKDDYLLMPKNSPLPLGIAIYGNWPLSVARSVSDDLKTGMPFTSPRGEEAWAVLHDSDLWLYPNWPLDMRFARERLVAAGYRLFVTLSEPVPENVKIKNRPGKWNWDLSL
jgi:U32 family peptidase